MSRPELSTGEALVGLLEAYGVDTIFGIPGVHNVEMYRALPRSRVKHVLARHEQGAGFMADGYARATGKPGICFTITGPGLTNIMTPLGQAWSDSSSILVISSALDILDGALARAGGKATPFGSFLDSTLDRAGEAGVYLGIAAYYLANSPNPTWPVLAAILALAGSFMVSYSRARAEGIGLTAAIGLAPRTERVVLIVAGLGLAGLGLSPALSGVLWVIAALTVATTAQRIWHVWRLTEATSPGEQP